MALGRKSDKKININPQQQCPNRRCCCGLMFMPNLDKKPCLNVGTAFCQNGIAPKLQFGGIRTRLSKASQSICNALATVGATPIISPSTILWWLGNAAFLRPQRMMDFSKSLGEISLGVSNSTARPPISIYLWADAALAVQKDMF